MVLNTLRIVFLIFISTFTASRAFALIDHQSFIKERVQPFHLSPSQIEAVSFGVAVGNGGKVVICDIKGQTQIYFYDYYYLAQKIKLPLFSNLTDPKSIVKKILHKMKVIDHFTATFLWQRTIDLEQAIITKAAQKNTHFFETKDNTKAQHIVPPNCSLHQLVVQISNKDYRLRYAVDIPLYEKLDPLNKAFMYLHEAIYSWMIANGLHGNSEYVETFLEFLLHLSDLKSPFLLESNFPSEKLQ